MPSQTPLALETFRGGAVNELFQKLLVEVLANIDDPECPAEATRQITIAAKIKPSETRQSGTVHITGHANLAKAKGVVATIFMGRDQEGNYLATEYDPRQMTIEDAMEAGQDIVVPAPSPDPPADEGEQGS
jgi:hypothetical protein